MKLMYPLEFLEKFTSSNDMETLTVMFTFSFEKENLNPNTVKNLSLWLHIIERS